MSELPKGWVETTIGSLILNMIGGASPKKENYSTSGTLALNKGDIKENGIIKVKEHANYLPQEFVEKHASKKVTKGAILVTLRDLSQKADFLGLISTYRGIDDALITQGMYALNTSEIILNDLLVLYSNTAFYRSYVKQQKVGATQVHLRNEQFLNIPFPLAPLAEQRRIVEKLDQVLAQVDTIKTRLDGIPTILKRFRQSVLAAAVSGQLTGGWRESNKLPLPQDIKLGQIICEGPQNGLYKAQSFYGEGVRIIRIDGFYDGEIVDWSKVKRLSLEDSEYFRWKLETGDILVNRVNSIEYLGKSAIVRELPEPTVFESNIMKFKVNPDTANPEYIVRFLCSSTGLSELRSNAKLAVNQASINQQDIKNCSIYLPALQEQTEIVRLVDQYFAFADTIEAQVQKAQQRVDKLTQSILAKAFRGKLVPQDPNDEPADELLKRIATARAEAEALAKAAKKATKKTSKKA
ncbi:restriction endonuclease subunit S [Marinomonas communis]|uniref:Type I restriction enzyme S subunit n=1 Tax=Marinomonas communis TaxID=28254 RepID=A0A4R6X8Q6_9GAMM|nr:restriction endonuclease subunit S [Marinomonas communis]TDR15505.1 type I restriction enzyme S subunit [Marinomonas communis]